MKTSLALFQEKAIRKIWHNEEWWFVVEDVVAALIDSSDPKQYIKRMRHRDAELNKGWVQIVPTLDVVTKGGKQSMNCANTEGIFRIIQSIPSPKAEPFKRWLAKVGYERVQEIENPEPEVPGKSWKSVWDGLLYRRRTFSSIRSTKHYWIDDTCWLLISSLPHAATSGRWRYRLFPTRRTRLDRGRRSFRDLIADCISRHTLGWYPYGIDHRYQ